MEERAPGSPWYAASKGSRLPETARAKDVFGAMMREVDDFGDSSESEGEGEGGDRGRGAQQVTPQIAPPRLRIYSSESEDGGDAEYIMQFIQGTKATTLDSQESGRESGRPIRSLGADQPATRSSKPAAHGQAKVRTMSTASYHYRWSTTE
jgi:hypothetical protein